MTEKIHPTCPRCQAKGRPVKSVTPLTLLREEFKPRIADHDWLFCEDPTCKVVYLRADGGDILEKETLCVRVGIKESTAPRPVCYCFNHTVEEIDEEIARTGKTTVLNDIKTRMKVDCWCGTTSPMGSCCLATVTRFVKAAQARVRAGTFINEEPAEEDCCSTHAATPPKPQNRRLGLLATTGAMASAILSSACCWLPLLLLAFGASAAGVAGFFEAWRPWFLGGAAILLGIGFHLAYFKKETCAPGAACSVPNPKLRRFNRISLWVAAMFVAAFALFPNYLGTLLDRPETTPVSITENPNAITLTIDGMTCQACAIRLEKQLAQVPGVARVTVDYADKRAVIHPHHDHTIPRPSLHQAVEAAGFQIRKTD